MSQLGGWAGEVRQQVAWPGSAPGKRGRWGAVCALPAACFCQAGWCMLLRLHRTHRPLCVFPCRPLWVCPDARVFLETFSPVYKQVRVCSSQQHSLLLFASPWHLLAPCTSRWVLHICHGIIHWTVPAWLGWQEPEQHSA